MIGHASDAADGGKVALENQVHLVPAFTGFRGPFDPYPEVPLWGITRDKRLRTSSPQVYSRYVIKLRDLVRSDEETMELVTLRPELTVEWLSTIGPQFCQIFSMCQWIVPR